jgi:hypothetical protein
MPIHYSSEMLDFDSDAALAGAVSDVCRGGLFIRCDFLELPGTRVKLQLQLPDGPVEFYGVVAWVAEKPPTGPGMGVSLGFNTPLEQAVLDHCRVVYS